MGAAASAAGRSPNPFGADRPAGAATVVVPAGALKAVLDLPAAEWDDGSWALREAARVVGAFPGLCLPFEQANIGNTILALDCKVFAARPRDSIRMLVKTDVAYQYQNMGFGTFADLLTARPDPTATALARKW